jgi:phospholipase C
MMVGRTYFTRQATTILKFARSTANPELAAMLVEKVADLKSQFDASPPPDRSPRAPDVEPPAQSLSK